MDPTNPYEAPQAALEAVVAHDDGGFLGEPRELPAGNGLQWIASAWQLVMAAPGTWIAMSLLLMLVFFAASLVPVAGGIIANLMMPVLIGGFCLACDAQRRGETVPVGQLFAGFSTNAAQLVLIGVLYMLATTILVVVALVAFFALGGFRMFRPDATPDAFALPMIAAVVVVFALSIPMAMANWFAAPLVAINGLPALEAMQLSFRACMRNIGAVVVCGLAGLGVAILASLPLFLGWLIAMPLLMATTYTAYRDNFHEP